MSMKLLAPVMAIVAGITWAGPADAAIEVVIGAPGVKTGFVGSRLHAVLLRHRFNGRGRHDALGRQRKRDAAAHDPPSS